MGCTTGCLPPRGLPSRLLWRCPISLKRPIVRKVQADADKFKTKSAAELATVKANLTEASTSAQKAASELVAKEADNTGVVAKLKTTLTATEEARKKEEARVAETSVALEKANKALADARKEFATKESSLQNNLTTLTEETSKAKRAAGEELSKAKEAVAKLEEEKANAVKEAAASQADRDLLKAEVEKLRKQLQAGPKPPSTGPEA